MSNLKRSKQGVSTYNFPKAYKGYTILTPRPDPKNNGGYSYVYLLDMNGNIVHTWKVEGNIVMHADLLAGGHIITSVILPDAQPDPKTNPGFNISSTVELDWDSNIVWRYDDTTVDGHDRARLKNGNTVVMRTKPIEDKELESRIQGGLPGSELGGGSTEWAAVAGSRPTDIPEKKIYTLVLTELTPQNEIVWEMDLSKALDPEHDKITPLTGRSLWPGLNSIEELPDGNLISTSYNLSQVFIWDKKTKNVKWKFGQDKDKISFPHDPHGLANGNVLLFDNGRFHSADPNGATNYYPPDFSRVIEIDPTTSKIVWDYRDDLPVDFYSSYISSCQRLPNGNTFICEGNTGRIFEVTAKGEIVWEYQTPFYVRSETRHGLTSSVFRAIKYDINGPELEGVTFDLEKQQKLNQIYGADALRQSNLF